MNNIKRQITRGIPRQRLFLLSFFFISFIFSSILFIEADASVSMQCNQADAVERTPKVEIRADGTTILDGEPFFPFGFYHVAWELPAGDEINTLRDIAAAGFNTLHTSVNGKSISVSDEKSLDEYEKLLDEAERLGVHVLTYNHSNFDTLEIVNKFKNKPAILGWSIVDDVHNGEHTPTEIFNLHCQVKNADPHHITYISSYDDKKISDYVNSADAIGIQAYPIGYEVLYDLNFPISQAEFMTSIAHRSASENRLIIANTQAFRWYDENAPIPTFEQVRNMTYQSVIAGAKGIIYYTYRDSGWYLKEHPNLWRGIQSLVPEIKQLSPMLLNGDLTQVETNANNILAGIWINNGEAIVIALNLSSENTTEVAIELPGTKAQAMFPQYSSDLILKNGKLSGSLAPLDVQIYRFKSSRKV